MKQYEIEEILEKLSSNDLANIFNVYEDPKLGKKSYTYNVNRTVHLAGLDNIDKSQYEEYIVKDGDAWTTISYKYYGTDRLWWLICKMNKIYDPSQMPVIGTKLKIMKESRIRSLLEYIRLN